MDQADMQELAHASYFGDPYMAAKRYFLSDEFAEVRRLIPQTPGRALDLGAGNGILSWALAQLGWDVTAVEPDPSILVGAGAIRSIAEKSSHPITVIESFGESIPLAEAGFDLVVARQVLHHANDLSAFCNEMSRLSRDGGIILTLRDHVVSGPAQLEVFFKIHPLHHLYGGENAFNLQTYRSSLFAAGISIKSEMRSFQSVINFDPMSKSEVRQNIAAKFGPLQAVVKLALFIVPFFVIGQIATFFDNRPGRLVSFLGVKSNKR
jgi:SAM-dependent methyltransferase